jgi:hypothetical protein
MYGVMVALVAAAFAFPALAAAEAAEEGAVALSPAPAHQWPWERWTQQDLEEAEPLPIITLPDPEAPASPEPSPAVESESASTGAEAARTAAVSGAVTDEAGAIEGIEVGAPESNLPPNSANGRLFGEFSTPLGNGKSEVKKYSCSGSVVQSPHGNGDVVLTAGHCVIDPETGTLTSKTMFFVPGYRNGTEPYGRWYIEKMTTTQAWANTAKAGSYPNEGGDLAFLEFEDNSEGESIEEAVEGSLAVAFDKPCNQIYTQFGYPAESPYTGEILYSHTAAYAGSDTNPLFSPVPMKIASDFTRGASGGPWATGIGTAPTVQSLTAYSYESQPGYLYGPYFGEAARKAYEIIIGKPVAPGIEETCAQLPVTPEPPKETVTTTPPATATPTPPAVTPPTEIVTLRLTRVRRRTNGSAVLTATVSTAGMLKLSGSAVLAETLDTPAAGQYRLVVSPKGPTHRRLLQNGRAKVGVKVAFVASGKTKRVSRSIQLSRRSAASAAPQPAPQSR